MLLVAKQLDPLCCPYYSMAPTILKGETEIGTPRI
jgi:hypothetical protein